MTPLERAEIQELLRRLAEGDRTAVTPAFEALWPVLHSFSARALGNDADAQDAAQLAITKLFAQVCELDPARDGVAWAFTIAAFECRTLRRRAGRRREVPDDVLEGSVASGLTPEEVATERELDAAVRELLRDLGDEDARAIAAAVAESRPTGDAAFRKRLQRALARLRLAWRAKHETQ